MIFGLSAAMTGEVTFAEGRAQQVTFWDFDPLRFRQCPPITVKVLESGGPIRGGANPARRRRSGAGECVFALTGRRIRQLPLNRALRFA